MATGGFRGIGWIACFAIVSPAFYMVSSMVAAERGRVEAVERAILDARRDLRRLETEFDTRANHEQLERWNGDVLALSAPRAEQYVSADARLADLALPMRGEGAVRSAALVVPAGIPDAVVPEVAEVAVPAAPPASPPARARGERVAMIGGDLLGSGTLGELRGRAQAETAAR